MVAGFANNVNPRGLVLWVVQLVFLVLALFFFLLRVYVKVFLLKKIALDDWLMALAMALYIAYGVLDLNGTYFAGTGEHVDQLTYEGASLALKTWYLCEALYPPLSAAIRCSIALFLFKLAVVRRHRVVIYVNLAVICVVSTVYFFIVVFQCSPPSFFWESVLGGKGTCLDPRIMPDASIVYSVIMATSDLSLALLPIWMLWKVKLNTRTKVTIGVLLSMGTVAGIALIVRVPYIRVLAVSEDFLYETVDVATWSVLEPSLGIMAGCIATLKPLFSSFGFGTGTSRRYGSKTRSTGGGSGGWRSTPKMQRLRDRPSRGEDSLTFSIDSEPLGPSDMELSIPRRAAVPVAQQHQQMHSPRTGTAATAFAPGSPVSMWDAEGGGADFGHGWPMSRPVVHVQTSIDVSSQPQQRQNSYSSGEPIFPVQGERTPRLDYRGPGPTRWVEEQARG